MLHYQQYKLSGCVELMYLADVYNLKDGLPYKNMVTESTPNTTLWKKCTHC
jgi:hypothetical protein